MVLAGRLTVSVNAEDPAVVPPAEPAAVDFAASAIADPGAFGSSSGLKVATGPDSDDFVILDFTESELKVSGSATISIAEFVHLSGQFAFEKSDRSM